jgi:hypothetical protein
MKGEPPIAASYKIRIQSVEGKRHKTNQVINKVYQEEPQNNWNQANEVAPR